MSVAPPELDPQAPPLFVINAASGSEGGQAKRHQIEAALESAGRRGEILLSDSAGLARVVRQAASRARATRTAIVAVGGDGTLNTIAQAAHEVGCAVGLVPQGTFNYVARSHGIPADVTAATRMLFESRPVPVQVAAVNDRIFLVNASLGLYPDLLEDRERYKSRFGRNRVVAFGAGAATLLHAQRRLNLQIELGGVSREVRALTLFVGNNRLQLAQLGVQAEPDSGADAAAGRLTAVMLRPIGTLEMLRLMWRGAMGTLGEADSVERFEFTQMVVRPSRIRNPQGIKIAYDGEVMRMRAPLRFRVLERPLFLMKPAPSVELPAGAVDPGAASE